MSAARTKGKAAPAPRPPAAAAPALVVDPARLTLAPRPVPGPEVMAAITAAVQQCWPRPAAPEALHPVQPTWRFSGRWWAQPPTRRRARPWVSR